MTSRERVRDALDHRQPDRVPIDFGGHRSSGISAIAYAKLKEALGISSGGIYVYDIIQQLAIVEEPVRDAFGVDVVEMGRAFHNEKEDWQEWELPDGTPCMIPDYLDVRKRNGDWLLYAADGTEVGIMKEGCLYFEQTTCPLMERGIQTDDFADLAEHIGRTIWGGIPHPGAHLPLNEENLAEMATRVKALRDSTDRAIQGLFGGNLFELPQWLYRMDNYLVYLGLYPDKVDELTENLCEIYLGNLERWLAAVGPYLDVIVFGDDLGGQNRPLISPAMYRRFFKERHRKLWNRAKKLADVKVNLHSCGAIEPLLDDFIDAGLDAVNPVQISCGGMEAATLKTRYGDRLTFWGGGCDTRDVLPNATPQEVKEHVKRQIDVLAPGGGFVFQQVHNILADVPVENIIAMFEAIRE